ncbi:MAG: hypothetical protein WKG07_23300 [Hymenobacter sp.]
MVPKWREVRQGTKEFRFAIDFGTTNTHVAYHDAPEPAAPAARPSGRGYAGGAAEEAGRCAGANWLMSGCLEVLTEDLPRTACNCVFWDSHQQREFMPPLLGAGGSPYQFPIRTATSEDAELSD